ncbi:regulator of G-protein signaling 6-like isoform X1 [Chaetodon auriga]|uniref:regulator of G-protein signaling 6-like isoform X1 n=1 Tax=Chaetodon auriga TaxID=39042 RepID=UPI004032A163
MAEGSRDQGGVGTTDPEEDSPNMIVYRKIEDIVTRIQDEKAGGVAIRTVKSFLSKIPSVVSGADIVQWLMKNLSIEDPAEAIHLGSLVAAHGYIFPISDHVLTLKDDGTLYRFQSPYFWPSNCWEPENTDYAIYLCKRTMQNKARLELADYEAENLARLQRAFARKWEFIFMQAEAQVKIDRKKDKAERKILDSQERAFWDVHRPVPGCVNTTEMDIRKCRRERNPHRVKKSVYGVPDDGQSQPSPSHISSQPTRKPTKEDVQKEITFLNTQLDRHCMKVSKVADSLMSYTEQFMEYDPFVSSVEPSNPWISDDTSFWDLEASRDPSQQRVKKWGFSLEEALKDPAGRDQFLKFLESEFSSENLRFWLAVQDLKRRPLQEVASRAQEIWQEFLAEGAPSSINLDSHSYERTSQNLKDPGRYSYEDAQEHIFKLMKSDSYARFLRSNIYQDLLLARKKQPADTEQGRRTSLEKFTRSVGKSLTGKRLTGLMQSS